MRRHRRQRSRSRTLKPKVGDVSVGDAVSSSRRGTHCGEPFGWLSHLAAAANGKQATVELGREAARAAATLFPAEATLHCWLASAASTSPHCVRSSRRPGLAHGRKAAIYLLPACCCLPGRETGRIWARWVRRATRTSRQHCAPTTTSLAFKPAISCSA